MNKTGKTIDLFFIFFIAFVLLTTDFKNLQPFQYKVFGLFGICILVRFVTLTIGGKK